MNKDIIIVPCESVKNLGDTFYSTMPMDIQISFIIRLTLTSLGDLIIPMLAHGCNIIYGMCLHIHKTGLLLFGLPKRQIHKVQGNQNTSTKLVAETGKYKFITPILEERFFNKVPEDFALFDSVGYSLLTEHY